MPFPLEVRNNAGTDVAGRAGYGDSHGGLLSWAVAVWHVRHSLGRPW
jgi:hypothetical protein